MTANPLKIRPPRVVADVGAGEIVGVVEIAAPPERVFRALTDPEEMKSWWGSADTYRVTGGSADLRPGGEWRSEGVGEDGKPFSVGGEIVEIDPPRLLVQTWRAAWEVDAHGRGGHTTTIRYRLDPIAGGTRVTLRHEGFADRTASCEGHAEGWQRVLGWLAVHAAPDATARQRFLCRLLTPRPTFPADISGEEAAIMKAHADYWRTLLGSGEAIAFGPVADPAGAWGLGLIEVESTEQASALLAADPAIIANAGFRYERMPMLGLLVRAGS